MPVLNRQLVCSAGFQSRTDVAVPAPELLDLPERAIQFGTGAFLRGFVEFFLDEANRRGMFGGRVVMVGSTGSGRDAIIGEQDGLYTLSIQGIDGDATVQDQRVISCVSRALSARHDWGQVLECARNPQLEVIFSNTTEVGIVLDEEDQLMLDPPRSFPGKLTSFLYERARAFSYDPGAGLVVIPCELIEDNGARLRDIVLELARRWQLDEAFLQWVNDSVPFCNTLVDRIVPGTPGGDSLQRIQAELGYRDSLLTSCEVYRLWAIEAGEDLAGRLRFARADPGIIIAPDISPYRERKVRLLNGSHTITTPVALMCGCDTVLDAVQHDLVGPFLSRIMLDEVAPTVDAPGADRFARQVLQRFANPFIRHELIDISLQQTMKMRVRIVPSLLRYTEQTGQAPLSLAFGFAAYLLFMRGELQDEWRKRGISVPADDQGSRITALWNSHVEQDGPSLERLVQAACGDTELWGADLTQVAGFAEAVTAYLRHAEREGVPAALEAHLEAAAVPTV